MIKATLSLEDGTKLEGYSFGSNKPMAGEVVFNTSLTGYTESLTDPSYSGQILVLTYPLIGNYGIPNEEKENDMLKFFESNKIHISGLLVTDYSEKYQHWNAEQSLGSWMDKNDVPGIYGIDTRALTEKLREQGSLLGKIEFGEEIEQIDPNQENLVAKVSTKEVQTYGDGKHKIVLVDCGVKNNIIRCLLKYDTTVVRVPFDYDFTQLDYDGLFISNGPGDPEMCEKTIEHLKIAIKGDKPIFGICLGNQLLGLAAGGTTFKMKYGHRSHNQPVIQKGTNRCFITSQNHGFALDISNLSEDWEEYFLNLNDNTCEGIKHKTKPFFSSQFHPEASGGPLDTEFLFEDFINLVAKSKA